MHNSRKKKMLNYARFLILVSIALFLYGLFLDLNNKYLFLGVREETVKSDGSVISVTPSEGSEVVSGVETPTNKSTGVSDSKAADRKNESINQTEVNLKLRDSIEKEFDIKILYGKDTNNYTIQSLTTTPMSDDVDIYNKLYELKNVLSKYPKGLFSEIKNGGIPLTIYLINSYSDPDITGVTDSSYNYANISIATIFPLEESFYHESYHYIERYLLKNGANYNSWDNLLPQDFSWGTIDGNLSYSNTFSEDSYFVNNYAQTSASEDRASTFEYMMADTKASCLNKNKTIWLKAVYMSRTIDSVLESVKPDVVEYWERFNEENNN